MDHVLIVLLLAPLVMVVATLAERRIGPAAAGWVAAAPVVIVAAVLAVSFSLGEHAGSVLAGGAAAHAAGQIGFALAFISAARRCGVALGLVAGSLVYALVALPLGRLPVPCAVGVGALAMVAGRHWTRETGGRDVEQDRRTGRPGVVLGIRATVALVCVGVVVLAAHHLGPAAAGAVSAYSAFSAALAVLVGAGRGSADAAAQVLRGSVRALPAYWSFCVAVWLTVPILGTMAAVVLGLALCGLVYRAVLPVPRTSPRQPRRTLAGSARGWNRERSAGGGQRAGR